MIATIARRALNRLRRYMPSLRDNQPKTNGLAIRRPGPYPRGRECIEIGCITVLSRWNEGPGCYLHSSPKRSRGAAPELVDYLDEVLGGVTG